LAFIRKFDQWSIGLISAGKEQLTEENLTKSDTAAWTQTEKCGISFAKNKCCRIITPLAGRQEGNIRENEGLQAILRDFSLASYLTPHI
jgi:hypothetical protein